MEDSTETTEAVVMDCEDVQPGTSGLNLSFSESDPNSDDSEEDEQTDDEDITPKKTQVSKRPIRKPISKLNTNLKGLMGEANLRYAQGDIETAKRMCFEVMRQAPDAYEPYLTLAQIFENLDKTKYAWCLTMASDIYPHDSAIWCRLAELNIQDGKVKEAISCYSKAVRASPRNMEIHYKRLELVQGIGDTRFALACKKHIANKLHKSQYKTIIELSKEVAKQYHEEKNYEKALDALRIPFKHIPKRITQDLINMKLELLLLTNRFTECLDIFTQYCNFTFELTVDVDNQIVIYSYEMGPNIQIDLKVKFIVCLIKLKLFHLVSPLIDSMIVEENVEEIGDLYLDVAEDLMAANLPHEALKLLVPLVKSTTYNLAAVWLKYAECLHSCDMLDQAVEAYFTVMTMAPQHVEVLYPLAMTLLKLNKRSEALQVLSQDLSTNKIDVAVLVERMKLLKQINDLDEYWKCAELLLSRHCIIVRNPEEIEIVTTMSFSRNEKIKKIENLRKFRKGADELVPVETNYQSIREPSAEAEYEIFRDILSFALKKKKYAQLQRFAFMGLTSKKFTQQHKDIVIASFFSCIYNKDTLHGYDIIRSLVLSDVKNNLGWNLFNILLQNTDDKRHNRFISRLLERLPNIDCLQIFEANYALSVKNINVAMKYYMKEFRKNQTPYLAFILGVTLLQALSKTHQMSEKQKMIKTIICLFQFYGRHRTHAAKQEIYYNLGRMYHELGVLKLQISAMTAAVHYYKKVLEMEDGPDSEILSLKYEAAFNLHLIYRNSGNYNSARIVLKKHIVIK